MALLRLVARCTGLLLRRTCCRCVVAHYAARPSRPLCRFEVRIVGNLRGKGRLWEALSAGVFIRLVYFDVHLL